jgi:uncharacterized protein YlxW (UPF0749 family)
MATRSQIAGRVIVALVAGLVGFLLVGQARGQQRFSQRLQAESEGDLTRILASLNATADQQNDEIATLKLQLQALKDSSQRDTAAERAARQQLADLQVLAGTVAVHGPGVVVTVGDPERSLAYDALIDVVEELRDAGAEAIAINQRRVGASTAFAEAGGAITIDGSALQAPYVVTAIGQASTLESGLKIPGGAVDALSAAKGVKVDVVRQADLALPALAKPPSFKAARPVASGG